MRREHLNALDTQLAIIREASTKGTYGYKYLMGFEESLKDSRVLHGGQCEHRQAYVKDEHLMIVLEGAKDLPQWIAARLDVADTYWVASEMVALVDHAVTTMDDEPLLPSDFPTPAGFAKLGTPGRMIDRRGRLMTFDALAWWPSIYPVSFQNDGEIHWHPGWEIAYFSNPQDPDDEINQDLARRHGIVMHHTLELSHLGFWPQGMSVDEMLEKRVGSEDAKVEDLPPALPDDEVDVHMRASMMWVKAFFRLIQQRVAKTTMKRPDRPTQRRAARQGSLLGLEEIRVITLRRYREGVEIPDTGPVDEEGRLWSHRWIVEGHWRNQWYPSLDDHRQIWIAPYVKGPEDRPLIIKDKVYRWSR